MLRIISRTSVAFLLIVGLGIQAFALANDESIELIAPSEESRETLVASILAENESENWSCEQLVNRIDLEIIEIDSQLDQEPANSDDLLEQREQLVAFRLSQPCHSEVVTPVIDPELEVLEEVVLCDEVIGEEIIEEEIIGAPMMAGCGYGAACGGCGGGGGGGFGGAGLPLLGLAGLAGLAGLDSNNRVSL